MHDPQLYARSFADVYDDWYGDLGSPADIEALVDAWTRRMQPPSTILELGSGSGRLSGPLSEAGYNVIGIDASIDMLALDTRTDHRVLADMADLPLGPNSVDGVLVAWNSLFNLVSIELQQRCFDDMARVLRPGGHLAVEGFLADPLASQIGVSTQPHRQRHDGRVIVLTMGDDDLIEGVHVEILPEGARLRRWRITYRSPGQLDEHAAHAGMTLDGRFRDWAGAAFDPVATRHVSWYRVSHYC